MKVQVEHHNRIERMVFSMVAVVLVILTIVLIRTRPLQSVYTNPAISEVSSPVLWSGNAGDIVDRVDVAATREVLSESMVEVEDWMMSLDGWINPEALVEGGIFVQEPFLPVQPWMMQVDEWLNPGYLEEMVVLESWMTLVDSWDNQFVEGTRDLVRLEEWMIDLSMWTQGDFSALASNGANEEWVELQPWMLSDDAWFNETLSQKDDVNVVEEPDIEVKAWMLSVDQWNAPVRSAASSSKIVEWQ